MKKKRTRKEKGDEQKANASSDESEEGTDRQTSSQTDEGSKTKARRLVESSGTDLRPPDVLLGRGTGPANHGGNVYFRDIVEKIKPAYVDTPSRKLKNKLVQEVVDDIKAHGGRFLRKLSSDGSDDQEDIVTTEPSGTVATQSVYEVVPDNIAFEKTKQAIRYVHYKKEPNEISKKSPGKRDESTTESHLHKSTKRPLLASLGVASSSAPQYPQSAINEKDSGSTSAEMAMAASRAALQASSQGIRESLASVYSISSPGSTATASRIPSNLISSDSSSALLLARLQHQRHLSNLLSGHPSTSDPQLLLLLAQQQQQAQSQQLLGHLSSLSGPTRNSFLESLLLRGASSRGAMGASRLSTSGGTHIPPSSSIALFHSLLPNVLSNSLSASASPSVSRGGAVHSDRLDIDPGGRNTINTTISSPRLRGALSRDRGPGASSSTTANEEKVASAASSSANEPTVSKPPPNVH